MNASDALIRLAESTADAVVGVLAQFVPDEVSRGEPHVVAPGADPFAGAATPSVACNVSYVDGVTGGNVFVAPLSAARKLAAAMGVDPETGELDTQLGEIELGCHGPVSPPVSTSRLRPGTAGCVRCVRSRSSDRRYTAATPSR